MMEKTWERIRCCDIKLKGVEQRRYDAQNVGITKQISEEQLSFNREGCKDKASTVNQR